jgi:geranylgeranyl diphosphate synthase, type II
MNALGPKQLGAAFGSSLPLPNDLEPTIESALRYVLENPGSLVRPQIVMQMSLAYSSSEESARDLAIALEYFHTASLLFDDLPCMDNATQRRGIPCVHLIFGESGAILTALALINRAYALAWRAVSSCSPAQQSRGFAYIERYLGVGGLLNGQSLDLNFGALPDNQETTERIALGKTVSLIRLSVVLPAMLGGAPAHHVRLLERIAVCWGLSYQILDDLKDLLQSEAEAGKTVARDLSLGRPNTALAIGIPRANERLRRLIRLGDRALQCLLTRRPDLSFLEDLGNNLRDEAARLPERVYEKEARGEA